MVTSHRLPCFPSQFRWAEQLFLFGPFNCYEAVALDSSTSRASLRSILPTYFNTPKPLPALMVFQDSPRDTTLSTKETIMLS